MPPNPWPSSVAHRTAHRCFVQTEPERSQESKSRGPCFHTGSALGAQWQCPRACKKPKQPAVDKTQIADVVRRNKAATPETAEVGSDDGNRNNLLRPNRRHRSRS